MITGESTTVVSDAGCGWDFQTVSFQPFDMEADRNADFLFNRRDGFTSGHATG